MAASGWICGVAFTTSALACYLIVRSAFWHLPFTADVPGVQPQKFHSHAVPRVGGLGVLAGFLVAGLLVEFPFLEAELHWLIVLSLMPAFLGGFAEDVTRRIGAATRLLLTIVTAAAAHAFAGVQFERSDVAWLDAALAFAPFGYGALLFAVAGVAHAINIIDGHNGLAAGVAASTLFAIGYVASQNGDSLLAMLCYPAAAAAAGFLLLNYPFGRLFLGDGGAYLLGCLIAIAAALLIQRNPEVSPWFPLALVIYPVWETLFSVLRRVRTPGMRVGAPDARHLHSLVYRRYARRWARRWHTRRAAWRNALTTLPFWAAQGCVCVAAVIASGSTRALALLVVVFMAGYVVVYWRVARLPRPRLLRRAARS